jgi:hypothetical protein
MGVASEYSRTVRDWTVWRRSPLSASDAKRRRDRPTDRARPPGFLHQLAKDLPGTYGRRSDEELSVGASSRRAVRQSSRHISRSARVACTRDGKGRLPRTDLPTAAKCRRTLRQNARRQHPDVAARGLLWQVGRTLLWVGLSEGLMRPKRSLKYELDWGERDRRAQHEQVRESPMVSVPAARRSIL